MQSVMSHNFSQVPSADISRSTFDRSHGLKTTFDAGLLIPVFIDEALPGDTFNLQMSTFARLATPIVPIMDNIFLDSFFFAVPIRLVWENFQKFMGEQANPSSSTDFLVPQMTSPAITGYTVGSLSDHMGIPIGIPDLAHSTLWHRAYNLIWNEWFRDQNLQNSLVVDLDNGPDASTDYVLQRRGKRHDYFTSCLPFPQKGPAVTLPLGSQAPVITNELEPYIKRTAGGGDRNINFAGGNALGYSGSVQTGTVVFGAQTGLVTDLTNATAATINALREAFQIQKLYERDARGGTRYTEIIRSHFGVTSDDARLQRPEYLGGDSVPVNISPIAQTSVTTSVTPQGNLAAMGVASSQGAGFTKSFTEHCLIIGLVSARADLNYQQGLNRMWSRRTRFDFFWPALQNIGEQAVLNKEIFAGTVNDNSVFGYQERYAEYRYKPSLVTGLFRSNAPTPLDIWHLSQDFASLPALNASFIVEDPPIDRVIAVPSQPHFIFDSYFRLKCTRPMPLYSVPGLIDHF